MRRGASVAPETRGPWPFLVLGIAVVASCAGAQAPLRPDDACVAACERRIPRCGADGCARGCQLSLDRLVEHEEDPVLACVERSPAVCDAWLWADCAARVGPHLDGGPPPPVSGPRR